MINTTDFIENFSIVFPKSKILQPWNLLEKLSAVIQNIISQLSDDFIIKDGIAIHKSATIENGAIIKSPVIINKNCFIGANTYLRNSVYLGSSVKIGPGCEIKTSIIFDNSSTAHFNFIGDSIIGNHVNFEAGAVIANHYNERIDKRISVVYNSNIIDTHSGKFGALVGDYSKIGANAVLSPGTILTKNSIVNRLELIDQSKKQ